MSGGGWCLSSGVFFGFDQSCVFTGVLAVFFGWVCLFSGVFGSWPGDGFGIKYIISLF